VAGTGFETTTKTSGNMGVSENPGAKSDVIFNDSANFSPDLAEVIAAWPKLPEEVREKIVAVVQEAAE
jgi:nitrous oxide reductase accessory protein NosL